MGKWLAIGGAALLILLVVMWRQLDDSSAAAPEVKKAPPAPVQYDALAQAKAIAKEEHIKAGVPEPVAPAPSADGKPAKLDPAGDEFFYKFQEATPAILSREVVKCYDGRPEAQRLHRNQKLTLEFKIKIKDGEVTISNVREKENTLKDAALTACFTQAVQRKTWHDDSLPDWEADDQLVIRPERGLKKYMRSNIDYVGAEAPRADDPVIRNTEKELPPLP
ncbi:MAG: hypothetical protein JNL83_17805 [Myxococcales bacterium]|nr:hypothetical protein [Myxococcales bacterium]